MDYKLSLEDDGHGGMFIHCDVNKYSSSIKRQILNEWSEIKERYLGTPIFALHRPDEHEEPEKHLKFLKIFNFSLLQKVKLSDGHDATLFVDYNGWRQDNAIQDEK